MALKACVSIDVDTLASIYKGLGCRRRGGYTYAEMHQGLSNIGLFFDEFRIKTTLFIVGNDLKQEKNQPYVKAIYQDGHEIASHSMTHPQGFRFLSLAEKEKEIAGMEEVCQKVIGIRPRGFRSPGWNMDDATLPILKRRGYLYDSSIFPTYLMPLMKLSHWLSMSQQPAVERTTMGQMNYMFAPVSPFQTGERSLAVKGQGGIIEFPLTVSPIIHFPFFATFLLLIGFKPFEIMYREIRTLNWPIHFQMHLSDFVDYNNDEMHSQMPMDGRGVYIPQALRIPIKKKWSLFEKMIDMMVKDYQFFTLQHLAESLDDKRQA